MHDIHVEDSILIEPFLYIGRLKLHLRVEHQAMVITLVRVFFIVHVQKKTSFRHSMLDLVNVQDFSSLILLKIFHGVVQLNFTTVAVLLLTSINHKMVVW